jgi:hypothetical protein
MLPTLVVNSPTTKPPTTAYGLTSSGPTELDGGRFENSWHLPHVQKPELYMTKIGAFLSQYVNREERIGAGTSGNSWRPW